MARGDASALALSGTPATIFVGGLETSAKFLPMALHALSRHPDQLELLRRRRDLLPSAVEELLRWDSPIQLTSRTALVDTSVAGHEVAAGTTAMCLPGGADRGGDRFESADELVLDRSTRGLAFGGGIHFCLGAALARIEVSEALTSLLWECSGFELMDDIVWSDTLVFRGISRMVLRLPVPRR